MVQRSAVVNDKEDETLHEELSVKDDSDFYNPQAFYANVITLFSKLRKGDCVQVKGPMTIYTRVNDGGRPLTWTSTDDDQHPTLEHVLVADVQKKYSLLKGSAKDGADLASFETMNEVFKKLHEEICTSYVVDFQIIEISFMLRKRRLHIGGQSNAAQRCLNDEHRFICSTSQCFERKPSSFPPAIYQLKHCKLCLAGNGQDIESTYL
ncbi:hypothetical protein CU097_003247 [Rhizopus azygosporus]|uniref:Uncharacterized protein n=1 Tax=Rhizopus azygosporus TaxID=86630 RepID=A0A367JG17_RHIAZ|nr:hypothetical protein CU097_003247 [Rhizopus azygosporus]